MNNYDYSVHYGRFHDTSEEHGEAMARWLRGMIEPHAPSERSVPVLDIGCGYGFALRAMRNMGFSHLLGLETSPQQAEQSRRAGFKVEVTGDTIEWLNHHPAEFDFILLMDVLEHIPVPHQVPMMQAIHRALRPRGKVLLTVPNANSILVGRWRYIDFTHYSSFTEHSFYFVLRSAGFDSVWMDSSKGIGRLPRRFWQRRNWPVLRKWLVRWFWLQVFKAEFPSENLDSISFELNLLGVGTRLS